MSFMDSREADGKNVGISTQNRDMPSVYTQLAEAKQEGKSAQEELENSAKTPLAELLQPGSYDTYWQRMETAFLQKYKDRPQFAKKAESLCRQNHAEFIRLDRIVRGKDPNNPPSPANTVEWYRKLGSYNELSGAEGVLEKAANRLLSNPNAKMNEKLIACQMLFETALVTDKTPSIQDFNKSRALRAQALQELYSISTEAQGNNDEKTMVEARALAIDIYFTDLLQTFRNYNVTEEIITEQKDFLTSEINKLLRDTENMYQNTEKKSDIIGLRSEIAMASLEKLMVLTKGNWQDVYTVRMATLREDRPADGVALGGKVSMRRDVVTLPAMSFDMSLELIRKEGDEFAVDEFIYQFKSGSEVSGYEKSILGLPFNKVYGVGGVDRVMTTLLDGDYSQILELHKVFLTLNEDMGKSHTKYYDLADTLYISTRK